MIRYESNRGRVEDNTMLLHYHIIVALCVGTMCVGCGNETGSIGRTSSGHARDDRVEAVPASIRKDAAACFSRAMGMLSVGCVRDGLLLAARRSVIPTERWEAALSDSEALVERCIAEYGEGEGADLLRVQHVGSHVFRFSYILRFRKFALFCSLTAYANGGEYWLIDYNLSQEYGPFLRDARFPGTAY